MKNPLQWEKFVKYYKQEYQIALKALEIIETETNIALGEDEAASIALHLVNSQLSGEIMAAAVQLPRMVNTILNIVKTILKWNWTRTQLIMNGFFNPSSLLLLVRFTAKKNWN